MTKIRHLAPVTDYLQLQGRYSHLFDTTNSGRHDTIAALQELADRSIRRYGLVDSTDEVP